LKSPCAMVTQNRLLGPNQQKGKLNPRKQNEISDSADSKSNGNNDNTLRCKNQFFH
jgi:hypothetical protein